LLVGDGNYDFKNHVGWNATNFMPPYLADVDPWLHETAADNRYATFTGSDLPALMLGRLSVESAAETQTVVNKIIQYETEPFPGDWTSRYLFVADDPDGYANYAGDFHYANDVGYQQVAPPLTGYRYYLNSKPDSDSYTYENPTALRADFLNQLDTGAAAVIYHGHSSWHQWSKDGLLRWNRDPALNDVWRMNNDTRLPIILQMTCFTGYFQHPEYPTLDESLQRQPAGGAIAVWGSAGLGVETGHRTLQAGFLQAVLSNGETNLGAAILAGQMELYAGQANLDLLDTFILFGDPALTINTTIQPLEKRNYLSVVNR
jgi:hypothetical protein